MSGIADEFVKSLPIGTFAVSGGKLLVLNRYMGELTGILEKEIPEEKFWELVHDDTETVRRKVMNGIPVRFKLERKKKDIWVEYRGAISHYNGKKSVFGCLIEVTSHVLFNEKMNAVERVSREMKVASNKKELYSLVMDFTKDVLGYKNCAILERDNGHLKIVKERGYDRKTHLMRLPLNGKGITPYVFNNNEARYVPDVLKAEEYIEGVPGARCEYAVPITFKDEKYGVFDVQNDEVDSITYSDRILFNTLVSEMATVLKGLQTLEKLRESESRYRILVENAKEGIIKLDTEENILFVNQSLSDLVGYGIDELKGMNLRNITTEEQFEIFKQKTGIRRKGVKDSYEAVFVHKNGKILNTIISAAPFYTFRQKFAGTFAIVTDITKMKEAEERAAFYHSLLRHDIGNKNQVIMGYLELLMDTELDEEQKELVEIAYGAIRSSNELIRKVKEMQVASESRDHFQIDMDSMMKKIVQEFSSEAEKRGIAIHYQPLNASAEGNELMREIFSNIIGNAIMHSGGKNVTISGRKGRKYIVISIEDDGTGIPEYIRESIFDKKIKGKDSKGSGLGLYLVKTIVDSYGGKIEVKEGKKGGTVFEIKLPRGKDERTGA